MVKHMNEVKFSCWIQSFLIVIENWLDLQNEAEQAALEDAYLSLKNSIFCIVQGVLRDKKTGRDDGKK